MRYTVSRVNCDVWYQSKGKEQPVEVVRADKDPDDHGMFKPTFPSEWWVPSQALHPQLEAENAFTKNTAGAEFVRIPLFSYKTPTKDLETLFATGVQAGLMAMGLLPLNRVIDRVHLVIGDVYDASDQYQVWIGLGFQLSP
jgi:hypothetical protein